SQSAPRGGRRDSVLFHAAMGALARHCHAGRSQVSGVAREPGARPSEARACRKQVDWFGANAIQAVAAEGPFRPHSRVWSPAFNTLGRLMVDDLKLSNCAFCGQSRVKLLVDQEEWDAARVSCDAHRCG